MEAVVLIGGFVLQFFTVLLGYLKLVVPISKANTETAKAISIISKNMELNLDRGKVDRQMHQQILDDLHSLKELHLDKSKLCSWYNGGADRLTAKISEDVLYKLKPVLDEIKYKM